MNRKIVKLGWYSSVIAFISILGYSIAQILQITGVLKFPFDEIFIYGFSLCISIPFLFSILSLHYVTKTENRIMSHAAVLTALMYAVFACFVYVVQLGVALPHTLSGKGESVQVLILTQHSLFWTLDGLVYICMGISTLFASLALENTREEMMLKRFFLANALMTPIIAIVYFYPQFSIGLMLTASPWIITSSGSMIVLAFFLKGKQRERQRLTAKKRHADRSYHPEMQL